MAKDKVKYTVTFPIKVSDLIDRLAEEENVSKPEIIRRSLAIYGFLHDKVAMGEKVCTLSKDGELKTEIVF